MRGKRGFTLIEVIVVMVILAILAGIVIISVGGVIGRGQVTACEADQQSVSTSVLSYYSQNNAWPADGEGDIDFAILLNPSGEELPYIDGYPQSDVVCDWHVDAMGRVYPNIVEGCPCAEE